MGSTGFITRYVMFGSVSTVVCLCYRVPSFASAHVTPPGTAPFPGWMAYIGKPLDCGSVLSRPSISIPAITQHRPAA
jgi:hypothetical protein